MSNARIDKLHTLGRMLRTEESLVDRFLDSDRLDISNEAKSFSRAIINYSRDNAGEISSDDVHHIYINRFSELENNEEYERVADIIADEFLRYDED